VPTTHLTRSASVDTYLARSRFGPTHTGDAPPEFRTGRIQSYSAVEWSAPTVREARVPPNINEIPAPAGASDRLQNDQIEVDGLASGLVRPSVR